ncbi:hypothetical protein BJ912DRAFT_856824 [Pholiota molesta]|nr:hypothetical protein BJ912DRAFT_856824 [Pholiota molesta]
MAHELSKQFNALPQSKGPAGTWHFDLRYNPLEPGPCHVLILLQPSSGVIHVERLPIGLPSSESGIEFFPESGKEAAPEIARAILHVFVNRLNRSETLDSPGLTTPAPSRLTTRDRDLAPAVGWEFKNLSVRPTDLYRIGLCTPTVDQLTNTRFDGVFKTMKKEAGYKGADAAAIPAPESIGLWNFKLDPVRPDNTPGLFKEHVKYLQLKYNSSRPPAKEGSVDMRKQLSYLISVLEEDPDSELVKADADDGDAAEALDYALRLYVGLACARNRTLARYYAVQAATLPSTTPDVRATAHSVLLDWHITASQTDFRKRYMYAACHHANVAAGICRRLHAPGSAAPPATPAVLWFMKELFEREAKTALDLKVFFKDAMWAMAERTKQLRGGQEKMQAKKLKAPLRYRCAAVGCGVEADRGKMLAQCAGKCDADKKPSYCSKECQKSDWKNHKPYCYPGAECSVIDDGSSSLASVNPAVEPIKSGSGALQVPITLADGSMRYVSSSTLDAAGLKELRDLAQENLTSFGATPMSMSIAMNRM